MSWKDLTPIFTRAAFSIAGGRYDIATFHINTLTNDLDAVCIPVVHYLRETDVITVSPRLLTCWLQPISAFGCSFVNETSRRQFTLHSPYHSILAPDHLSTGRVRFPSRFLLYEFHCPRRFTPLPCRMAW